MTSNANDTIEHYKRAITSGELAPGAQIRSVRDLVTAHGISERDARTVLRVLAMEGYVESRHGSGTYVLPRESVTLRVAIAGHRQRGEVYAGGDDIRITSAETLPAPDHVADVLGIAAGAPAVRRAGIVSRGGQVLRASYSWHPAEFAELVPELLAAEHSSPGSVARIEAATGRTATVSVDGHQARALDAEQAVLLGLPGGTTVLVRDTVWRDDEGVFEFGEAFYHPSVRLTSEYGR